MSGLGRGLGSLFGENFEQVKDKTEAPQEIELSKIEPNANQPRKNFDENAMAELVNSIRIHGVISPIIVVQQFDKFMIIAGERRYRAAKKAGLRTIPAIVRDYSEKEIKEISLIENLQREDLNPIETANAVKELMRDYNYTQEEVADRIGKSRPNVANLLRLLNLSPEVRKLIEQGRLTSGHARCLVVISDPKVQLELAMKGVDDKMSVRDFEKTVKKYLNPKDKKKNAGVSLELKSLVERMQHRFATKVSAIGNDNKGRIFIDYYTRDDLDRLVKILDDLDRSSK